MVMIYQVPTEWTKISFQKDPNINNIIEWCYTIMGAGKIITYTYFSPGDVYSIESTDIENPLWILEKDINFTVISFKEKQHAFLFTMRWL
jgi:hypothetical protein